MTCISSVDSAVVSFRVQVVLLTECMGVPHEGVSPKEAICCCYDGPKSASLLPIHLQSCRLHTTKPQRDNKAVMYNSRASMVQPTPRSTHQKKREEENSFMTLVRVPSHLNANRELTRSKARQRDCRLYQRHWHSLLRCRSPETKPSADPAHFRMVRRASHERHA